MVLSSRCLFALALTTVASAIPATIPAPPTRSVTVSPLAYLAQSPLVERAQILQDANDDLLEPSPDSALVRPIQKRSSWPDELFEPFSRTDEETASCAAITDHAPSIQRWSRVYHEQDSRGIWSMGSTYKALSSAEGFTYIPFLGSHAPKNYPVRFRLSSITLGGDSLPFESQAQLKRVGNRIILDRGPVQVWYDMSVDFVEQSFALQLAGQSSDVVLDLEVQTDLERVQLTDGVSYSNDLGGMRYRKAIVYDGAGRRLELPIEVTPIGLRLRVPGSFLETAQAPVVIDPILSTYSIQGGSSRDQFHPKAAYDRTSDVFAYVNTSTFSATDHDIWIETVGASSDDPTSRAWTDMTSDDHTQPTVANDNSTDTFLVVSLRAVLPLGHKEVMGRTHRASNLAASPIFVVGSARTAWTNLSVDVGGNSVNTPLFKVVWDRNFPGHGYSRIRSATVTPTNPHSTSTVPAVGRTSAVTSGSTHSDRSPRISKSSGRADNAEWLVVYARELFATGETQIRGSRFTDRDAPLSGDREIGTFADNVEIVDTAVSEGIPNPPGGLSGDRVYCLAIHTNLAGSHSLSVLSLVNLVIGAQIQLSEYQHSGPNLTQGHPSLASMTDRFVLSYMERDALTGGMVCNVSSLNITNQNGFAIAERKTPVGAVGLFTQEGPGSASRFSGGHYLSRYMGVAHTQHNATSDINAARFWASGSPAIARQYCSGTPNSTGDYGFITMLGIPNTSSPKILKASALPTNQVVQFLVGHGGFVPFTPAGSSGVVCLGGGTIAVYGLAGESQSTGSSGTASFTIDPTLIRSRFGNVAATAGSTFNFQAWNRDVGGTSNFTNAVSLQFD